ncbi:serine hydrolase [Pseudopedobacter beijingensis]|uniref:Serine hydrolase n=1 Tax=Pseudopedobacter beijingensis TaxID=1207056 RepID=A0ABW4IBA0_9SPHI
MIRKTIWASILFAAYVLQACGQAHQRNKNWLEDIEKLEKQMVVLNNQQNDIPLKALNTKNIASINLGFDHASIFDSLLNKYDVVRSFSSFNNDLNAIQDDLNFYNQVIVTLTDSALYNSDNLNFIKSIQKKKKLVIALFGNGSSLPLLNDVEAPIVWNSERSTIAASLSAQVIFGGREITNKLTQDYSAKYTKGSGYNIPAIRLAYSVPEEVGLNSNDFSEIDKIVQQAITERATPGAVVLVAQKGKVIFNKAYGKHTYESDDLVKTDDIYDLASVTKITATTIAAMKLFEEGKFKLSDSISQYIKRTKGTDKANITIKDILLHQAGFIPYIPFYKDLKPTDFQRDSSENYSVKVADSFFLKNNYYKDVMWKRMLEAPLRTPGKYVYSDLSMYYMKEVVEGITGEKLPLYLEDNFYKPLGMKSTLFNPRNKFEKKRIVPTELDGYFRNILVWGYVHDQGAAMAGGVAGHAGLFSDATDLATISQMLLNKGSYGDVVYFKPQTVELFTSKQSDISRRGLGFDRWDQDKTKKYPSEFASSQTYGHTGYTGTCLWIDPARELIYIFLSNRVYPKVTNKILELNTRSRIQDVIYKAIEKQNNKTD